MYFTRICLAKPLHDRGFPFDVKVSLLTRDRAEAVIRNVDVASTLKKIIKSINHQTRINDFIQYVDEVINDLRAKFDETNLTHSTNSYQIPVRQTKLAPERDVTSVPQPIEAKSLDDALTAFITSKAKSGIRPLSVKQLQQRIGHFIDAVSSNNALKCVNDITTADALRYRDTLLTQGRSYKTNKEYLAAVFQFFKWCTLMNLCVRNNFEDITVGKKPKSKASQGRKRWSHNELKQFLMHQKFKLANADLRWVTLLLLHSGLRPSEACQLCVSDIKAVDGIACISVDDSNKGQRIKNLNARRLVPIHDALLELGFMAFVESRKGHKQLFDYQPVGINEDWAKGYCKQLAKLQTEIGMPANNRPTAYSFRHTFVDELKQLDISEPIVAQLVGHANPNITYGRYGKDINLTALKQSLAKLVYKIS